MIRGDPVIGCTTLTQLTVGLQLGAQAYSELILFKDQTALDDFERGDFELGAQVSAVALTVGACADARYNGGVAILTVATGGLMYEAGVGGQKFSDEPRQEPRQATTGPGRERQRPHHDGAAGRG